jgi:hypothetical protein
MGILVTTTDTDSLKALKQGVDTLKSHPQFEVVAQMIQSAHDTPDAALAHTIYSVDLHDLASGNGLAALQVVGHRYFAKSADGTHFAIEVHQDKKTAKHHLGEVARGNMVDGVQQILDDPLLKEKLSGADFTLSTLRINALGIHALWFHADNPVTDIIIGIPLTPPYLEPWPRTYNREEFETAVKDAAKQKLEFNHAAYV